MEAQDVACGDRVFGATLVRSSLTSKGLPWYSVSEGTVVEVGKRFGDEVIAVVRTDAGYYHDYPVGSVFRTKEAAEADVIFRIRGMAQDFERHANEMEARLVAAASESMVG